MKYNDQEKFAILHLIDSVILADGLVHTAEVNALSDFLKAINYDSIFLIKSRNLATEDAIAILIKMSEENKSALVAILNAVAISDGYIHQKETDVMAFVFNAIGLTKTAANS